MLSYSQNGLQIFEALADRAFDGVCIVEEGTIIYANKAFRAMSGYGDDAVGLAIQALYPGAAGVYLAREVLAVLAHEGAWQGILTAQKPDGSAWRVQVSISMLPSADGQPPLFAAFHRDVTVQHATEERLQLFELLVENATDGIVVVDLLTSAVLYMNPVYQQLLGFGSEQIGRPISDMVVASPEQAASRMKEIQQHGRWRGVISHRRTNGALFPADIAIYLLPAHHGQIKAVSFVRDITEEQHRAAELMLLQEQVIAMQQATLRELSTPLLPIADDVIVLPLIGSIDSARAQLVMETLLQGIVEHHAHTVIIDITGVPVVDTHVAQALIRAAQAVKLLGSHVVLTGIRPEVAQTLVGLGIELGEIVTRSSLQRGVAFALQPSLALRQ